MKTFFLWVISFALGLSSSTVWAGKPACKVNVNTATAFEIQSCLEGVGEKKAEAIVNARKSGDFNNMMGFTARVSGIGEKTAAKNVDRICFDAACVKAGTQAAATANQIETDDAVESAETAIVDKVESTGDEDIGDEKKPVSQ